MNILPKKRWHVRTKENIARVRKDEAEAAEQEKERVRRLKLAEQEARTAYLRAKAHGISGAQYKGISEESSAESKQLKSSGNAEANIYTVEGNINFFRDLEDGKLASGTNKEHEEEKKAEQEKYEKSIGYLTYLGQDSLESKGKKAWYELHSVAKAIDSDDETQNEEVGLKSKSKLDPINDIIKYTGLKPMKKLVSTSTAKVVEKQNCNTVVNPVSNVIVKEGKKVRVLTVKDKKHKKKHGKKEHKYKEKKFRYEKEKHALNSKYDSRKERISSINKDEIQSESEKSYGHRKNKKRKKKKDHSRKRKRFNDSDSSDYKSNKKKRRRDRSRSRSNNSEASNSSCSDDNWEEEEREKQKKLEVLRTERLKREAEERRRAERLLSGQKPETVETVASSNSGYQQKYNSQYNPHIARQNQEPKSLESGIKYWLQ